MTYPKIEIGDQIQFHGRIYTIAEIVYQDNDEGYYMFEGRTTDGEYRVWKQRWDGGALMKKRREGESKEEITKQLEVLLKMTRMFNDLDTCEYTKDANGNEYVVVTGKPNENNYRWKYRVNVTWDSGIALINDVLARIS